MKVEFLSKFVYRIKIGDYRIGIFVESKVVEMARRWGAPVVAEVNQGGALVTNAINAIDPKVKVFEVSNYICWGTPDDYETYLDIKEEIITDIVCI